jgi:hypothetical protein
VLPYEAWEEKLRESEERLALNKYWFEIVELPSKHQAVA